MVNDWTTIDYSPGIVEFIDSYKHEDMLQVNYPPNYILDMGWYGDKYIIYIVRDHDWDDPLYMFSAVDEKELMHIMFKCINIILNII